MQTPRWTLDEAVAFHEQQAADGVRSGPVLAEVARRLAARPDAPPLLAQAGEGYLTLCPLRGRTMPDAWETGPLIDVRPEADLIDDVVEDLGEVPDDLDPSLWQVELQCLATDAATGHATRVTARLLRCPGDPATIARAVLGLAAEGPSNHGGGR